MVAMKKMTIPILVAGTMLVAAGCGNQAATPPVAPAQCGAGTALVNGVCQVVNDTNISNPADTGGGATDAGSTTKTDTGGGTVTDAGTTPKTDAGGGTTTKDAGDPVDAGPPDPWCDCPPEKKNPAGLEHGKKCDKHDDCLYGYCMTGGHLTGYDDGVKFCTKNNACGSGGDATQCEADGKFKSGFEKTKESGNDKFSGKKCGKVVKVCAKQCKSDGDCKAWNPELPHCIKTSTKYVSMGVIGICVRNPLK